jgi:activating signal cointegrator complex subunit 2
VADLLYNKWLVDVPKMMDLAVLYAPGSSQLVRQLLQQLLTLQPRYAQVGVQLAGSLLHCAGLLACFVVNNSCQVLVL